ncbi:MAG: ATP-binding protein [bacterium]
MPIHIDEINVRNLGPVAQLSVRLGALNLIYGHNEQGKTYLVEFLIRSLFRNSGQWKLRGSQGQGRVSVKGISAETVHFSPDSTQKLEDFWQDSFQGLPADFSKLLVVKAAEVELANVAGGVNKAILKRYLSSKEILDHIDRRITKTIRESRIENHLIIGQKRGEIAVREELSRDLESIDRLFDQIDKGYSGGRRQTLADQIQKLEEQQARLLLAKQHLAFKVAQEISSLKEARSRIAREKLEALKSDVVLFTEKTADFKRKQEEQKRAALQSDKYEWLRQARDVYEKALNQEVGRPSPLILIGLLLAVGAVAAFALLKNPAATLAALTGVVALGLFYLLRYQKLARQAVKSEELGKIQNEFRKNFGRESVDLASILELLQEQEAAHNTAQLLAQQLSEDSRGLEALQAKLAGSFYDLTGERQKPESWEQVLRQLSTQLQDIENAIREKEIFLAQLGVDASDYRSTPAELEYSKHLLEEVEAELDAVRKEIAEETRKLDILKQLICQQTGDDIATDWESLILNLRNLRERQSQAYKTKTAEILGKIAVHNVLEELRKTEDAKIIAGLNSNEVQSALFAVTNRYKSLRLEADQLLIADQFQVFPLEELSTGAQEQTLLALRIGFSSRLMKRDALFLILDDAFQFSDWNRRDLLLGKAVALVKNGWQIIYLTMDDNIRDRFLEQGKAFNEGFKYVELKDR